MGELLLAQAKAFNNLVIPIRVSPVEIVQQAPPLVHHHDKPTARCMVFHVTLEVRRQVVDAFTQQCNLHFRRSRIFYMCAELFDQHCLGVAQVPPTVVP